MSSSRIPGFYRLALAERRTRLASLCGGADLALFDSGGIDLRVADTMIENAVGTFALPLGVALNFLIDGRDVVIPMATEEPSVVAAASFAARIVRGTGGFKTEVSAPIMIAQVELRDVPDPAAAGAAVAADKERILARARALSPGLVNRGGGPTDIEMRVLAEPTASGEGGVVVAHILVDCRDAMGANIVNAIAEGVADELAAICGGRVGLRILSNLSVHRKVVVTATAPDTELCANESGEVRAAIAAASRFAELDPYRAATHNKGIMNGVDAVLVATANDWRGVEAGAHAYACRDGHYRPLATWRDDGTALQGRLELPLALGIVGGAIEVHPGARTSLAMMGIRSAAELAAITAAAGLATNLAALRALATEGISRGHMTLHARKEQSR